MAEIKNLFLRILLEHNSGSKLSDEMEQLLIKQLLITVYRCTTINFDNTYDDVVARIKRQFENEYHKPFTLAMLAKQNNMSYGKWKALHYDPPAPKPVKVEKPKSEFDTTCICCGKTFVRQNMRKRLYCSRSCSDKYRYSREIVRIREGVYDG
jgi:hypothetical protein